MDEKVFNKVSLYKYQRTVDRPFYYGPVRDEISFTRSTRRDYNTNPHQPFMDGGARNIIPVEMDSDVRYKKQLENGAGPVRGTVPRIRPLRDT